MAQPQPRCNNLQLQNRKGPSDRKSNLVSNTNDQRQDHGLLGGRQSALFFSNLLWPRYHTLCPIRMTSRWGRFIAHLSLFTKLTTLYARGVHDARV